MTTLATVGIAMSPHLFRTSAASTAAANGGENPYLASALLHHTHPSVTNGAEVAPIASAASDVKPVAADDLDL